MAKGHADECDKNFDGTSGAMEMHAALIMWRRSISDCQMRFVSMLSDGDSKTFQFLSDNKIYGSDIKIEKEECLNHIAKRLGTSLRNKVKEWKEIGITGMWVRLGSTDLMAGKIMFLRSNQGGRFDGNESVADSFRSDLVNFKSSCTTILGAFTLLLRLPEKPSTFGKLTCYPRSIPSVALSLFQAK
ncbi:uncharacterized protein TNCV_2803341 [Trichonephila clavipes]|nr:uncharacterized protein TNCV_2803341 [Trichonephila clavipes]